MNKTITVLELISFLRSAQRSKVFTAVLDSMVKQFKEKAYLKTNTDSQIMFQDYASESTINFPEFKEIVASISQIDSITVNGKKLFTPSKRHASLRNKV